MSKYTIMLTIIIVSLMLVGLVTMIRSLYLLIREDANRRNINNAGLWAFLSIGGNNSSGLLIYLIKRRNDPIVNEYPVIAHYISKQKKIFKYGIVLFTFSFIILIFTFILKHNVINL